MKNILFYGILSVFMIVTLSCAVTFVSGYTPSAAIDITRVLVIVPKPS